MRHNSEKNPEPMVGRIPLVVIEQGRKLLRSTARTARTAGSTAKTVAREGRRFVGQSVDRTERYTRRHPWMSISGAACAGACAGACIGALMTFLFVRD